MHLYTIVQGHNQENGLDEKGVGCPGYQKGKMKMRDPGKAFHIRKGACNILKATDELYYLYNRFLFLHFWLILLIYYSFRLLTVSSSGISKGTTLQ